MKTYPFSALLGRMKYITRWSLMRSGRAESLSEHTADMLGHWSRPAARNGSHGGAVPRCAGNFDRRHAHPSKVQK